MSFDWVECAIAGRPKPGEQVSGDECRVIVTDKYFVAVLVDGLGHGPAAREAALIGCDYVANHAEEPLLTMIRGLDRALVGSRGAAASIVRIERADRRLQFVGVGNVELRARSRVRIEPLCVPGILGRGLRQMRTWEYELSPGDVVAVFTDGVSSRFEIDADIARPLGAACNALLAQHQRELDDATMLLVRLRDVAYDVSSAGA